MSIVVVAGVVKTGLVERPMLPMIVMMIAVYEILLSPTVTVSTSPLEEKLSPLFFRKKTRGRERKRMESNSSGRSSAHFFPRLWFGWLTVEESARGYNIVVTERQACYLRFPVRKMDLRRLQK